MPGFSPARNGESDERIRFSVSGKFRAHLIECALKEQTGPARIERVGRSEIHRDLLMMHFFGGDFVHGNELCPATAFYCAQVRPFVSETACERA
jgi:hypothetical protein